jgi:hypothetical protein
MMKLNQDGSRVVGEVQVTGSARLTNAATEASLQGDQLVLSGLREVTGNFTVAGDTMSGRFLDKLCQGQVTLRREPFEGPLTTSRLRTIAATVEYLDLTNRVITLRGAQGGTLTTEVDKRVQNLHQISVGDIVTIAYYESWALVLSRTGEAPSASGTWSAAAGQPPAGFGARRSTIQATVTAIDAVKPSVTFKGPRETAEISVATTRASSPS